ncbi:beta-lactamase family protein [Colwellia sp. BRX10-3]|uniref:serine hydrolase domain-containing protein n=1 Tax=Colwellia sp. BRX10-3 TaxID=2759844 RepID=UPI0015F74B97|nr:serine hydrolase domain-containing protein [Colwellia sp. BRX10-3]MBA6390946.1 beta-lactamase family protein [Colwellia sp. BRX10-3]
MYKLIITMLLTLSSNVLASKENSHDELTVTLEQIRIKNDIPSMAVAIISSGEVTYIKGFGFLDEMQTQPTTDESLFRIASISKLFTAQAVMQLVEDEKLGLNEKVGQYLPSFKNSNITIKQLLTHSSGVSDIIKPVNFEEKRSVYSYLDLVNNSISNNIENKSFEYSDTNFNILGAVISAVSGKKYEKFIYDNILKPASMKKSNYFDGINAYFAEARPTHEGKLIDEVDKRPYDLSFNPSEGLVSNVHDLSQWLKLTLANDSSLLKERTYKEMLAPQIKTSWGEIYMALGWQVYKSKDGNVARHPGSIRGYKSLVLTYPHSKNAMILLTNSSNTPRWEVAKLITEILKQSSEW